MQNINYAFLLSRPVWGAWIEIIDVLGNIIRSMSRPVWGAWIEILGEVVTAVMTYGRAPYGARGLKWTYDPRTAAKIKVAPRMGRVD